MTCVPWPELRNLVDSTASLRRSSKLGQASGGVTPTAKLEPATEEAVRAASAESAALSSEQRSVQEGNEVDTPSAVTAELP